MGLLALVSLATSLSPADPADNATLYALRSVMLPYLGPVYPAQATASVDMQASWAAGGNPCTWVGVSCDSATGKVVSFYLDAGPLPSPPSKSSQFGLTLPAQLLQLTSLASLTWANTFVAGSLSGIGALSRLTALSFITVQSLSGGIPPGIAGLTQLQTLQLSFCNIDGTLPDELWSLRNLGESEGEGVRADENKLLPFFTEVPGGRPPHFTLPCSLCTLYFVIFRSHPLHRQHLDFGQRFAPHRPTHFSPKP